MTEIIIEELTNMGLNLQDIRGQGYDNGSNMKGDKARVQSRIKNLNSRAFYVPCSKLTLKPLSATRWESRIEALKPLRFQIGEVYNALLSIYENQDIDNLIRDESSGLLNCIKQFKFLCSIVVWYKILNCINPISKLMQTKDFDQASALDLLKNCKKFFKDLRSDKSFNESLIAAGELAAEIDIEANFESTIPRHRIRRKKNIFPYESRDKPIEDPKEKYKI
ncbi:uncharacterized protein [Onthophagus taurus]|uniref:uncharacterized protein n=1 Tax=Onthophagus taurus TaxID=166361 RepID=UPI0039BEC509